MKSVTLTLVFLCFSLLVSAQAYPDRHNTSWNDGWISCQTSQSPNAKRGNTHWILYDLGDEYSLHESKFWNNNVPEETNQGFKDVAIDYSINGQDWFEYTTFELPEGPASSFYEGDEGPDFDGLVARYVLVTGLTNYGGSCFGLSEVKVNATVATSTNTVEGVLDLDLLAAPNPATEYTMITIGGQEAEYQYNLTDNSGRIVRAGKVKAGDFRINTTNLPTGIYSFSIANEEGRAAIQISVIK